MASSSISIQVSSPSFSKSSKTAASSNVCFVSHRGKRIKSRSNRCSIRSVPQKDTLRFFHSKRLVCASAASVAYDAMPKDAPLPSLYPPEPKLNRVESEEPKLKVVIVGGGLAGLSTAVELLEAGHDVELYEQRSFIGGKVASFKDKDGNHIEMGLHVFFGCYFNLFRLMAKCGAVENLLLKDHSHTFINTGGDVRELDFRFSLSDLKIGAPFHGLKAFFTTEQLSTLDKAQNALALAFSPVVKALFDGEGAMRDIRALDNISFSEWFLSSGGSRGSIDRMWDPIAYALGFIDCDNISARCMLTIFQFFATKTDASVLRMLNGSPELRLLDPIVKYIESKGGKVYTNYGCREICYSEDENGNVSVDELVLSRSTDVKRIKADAYVAALDVPGAKRLLPSEWRKFDDFDRIHTLVGVPVCTVQLRYKGWITELKDGQARNGKTATGLDNLLYSADADFSCFADLAVTSPVDYFIEGKGSLMQCVLTPADPYMPLSNDEIARRVHKQVIDLFPSARDLGEPEWSNVVKISQSLYREAPGMDAFRPDQRTSVPNFYLAGSYTKQDYIDSMEGATLSGRQCAAIIRDDAKKLKVTVHKKEIATATV